MRNSPLNTVVLTVQVFEEKCLLSKNKNMITVTKSYQ